MDESGDVIHTSRWAVTRLCGNVVRKEFLHDNFPKINKECDLLRLSTGKEVKLFYEKDTGRWVCETSFIELHPIFQNGCVADEINKLKDILRLWKHDSSYISLVKDDWSRLTVPWYCELLHRYISGSSPIEYWLRNCKALNFIHGDLTLSNVFRDNSGRVIVLDYENASLGPKSWDEATLVYSLAENNRCELAKRLCKEFSCDKEILLTVASVRLAQSFNKGDNVECRKKALEFIMTLSTYPNDL